MGIVLHLLPHLLLLLPLLETEVLLLRLKPARLLLCPKLLIVLLLLVLFGLAVDFLPDSLKLCFSLHTLSRRVVRVVRGTRRWGNIVANMVVVAFFRIWVLKHLVSLFDMNEPFIE
jgi:hypothetical protein